MPPLFKSGIPFFFLGLILTLQCSHSSQVRVLPPKQAQERSAPKNALHDYLVHAEKDHLVALKVDQKGVDLRVTLYKPTGTRWFSWDSPSGPSGTEFLVFNPALSGPYQVEITALDGDQEGAYSIEWMPVPPKEPYLSMVKATDARRFGQEEEDQQEKAAHWRQSQERWLAAGEPQQAALVWWQYATHLQEQGHYNEAATVLQWVIETLSPLEKDYLLSFAWMNLARILKTSGNLHAAIEATEACLALRTKEDKDRAFALINLGSLAINAGGLDEGRIYLAEAEDIYKTLGETDDLPYLYAQIGWCERRRGNYKAALESFEKGLRVHKELSLTHQRRLRSYQSLTYIAMGDGQRALKALETLKELIPKENQLLHLLWQINRAEVHLVNNQPDQARSLLNEIALSLPDGHLESWYHLRYLQARASYNLGDYTSARKEIHLALELADSIRLKSKTFRLDFTVSRDVYADFYMEILQAQANTSSEALEFNESRRKLMQQVQDRQPMRRDQLLQLLRSMDGRSNATNVSAQGLLDHYQTAIQLKSQEQPYQGFPWSAAKRLAGSSNLIYFGAGSQNIHAWVIGQEGLKHHFSMHREETEHQIRDLYELLKTNRTQERVTRYQELLTSLSTRLIHPLEPHLQGPSVTIIPDSDLYHLPFALLQRRDGHPLSESLAISYLSSLSQGETLLDRTPSGKHKTHLFLVANPDYQSYFSTLSASELEAKVLLARAHDFGAQSTYLSGKRANKRTVLGHPSLALAQYIHFACHAVHQEATTEMSSLALAACDEAGDPIEVHLYPHEIATLSLNAPIVVLSACETALGRNVRTRGIGGFPKAFIGAGARAIVVTLWKIDDDATAQFMDYFYGHLYAQENAENLSVQRALQGAQQQMRTHPKWYAPYYWAGFVVFAVFPERQRQQ